MAFLTRSCDVVKSSLELRAQVPVPYPWYNEKSTGAPLEPVQLHPDVLKVP